MDEIVEATNVDVDVEKNEKRRLRMKNPIQNLKVPT